MADLAQYQDQAENPNWPEFDVMTKRVHEWRTYVPHVVREQWDQIPLLGRCAIVACCELASDREEWD